MEYQGGPPEKSPTYVDMGSGATQERCIPVPQRVEAKPMAVETQQMDIPSAMGVQRSEDKPMAACTRYMGDDLNTGIIHLF